MQHTVAKRFIYCKHNITIPHTQVIPQKVVTFFENLKSWSHLALFVGDWIAWENRIASDFTRFLSDCKRQIRRDWLLRRPMSAPFNAFPLESSAMCNKKAVLCTASFVISEHCIVQARQCSEKQKPPLSEWLANDVCLHRL